MDHLFRRWSAYGFDQNSVLRWTKCELIGDIHKIALLEGITWKMFTGDCDSPSIKYFNISYSKVIYSFKGCRIDWSMFVKSTACSFITVIVLTPETSIAAVKTNKPAILIAGELR